MMPNLTRFIFRIGLAALIIMVGVITVFLAGETRGLALADLPETSVRALAASPQSEVMYVGLVNGAWPAGLYRSDDNGRNWQAVAPQLNVAITALAVSPADETLLYAGTSGGSLFKTSSLWSSDDAGKTWRRLVAPLPAGPGGVLPAVTALAMDPARPHLLYVGTDGHGVYQYDLDRNGYELLGDLSLRQAHVRAVTVGAAGRVYALTGDGLYVTEQQRWQRLASLPEAALTLAVAPGDPEVLYAGTPSSGAYRSADGGQSWTWLGKELGLTPGTALRVTALAVDEHDPAYVVAATAQGVNDQLVPGGLYESRDAGQSWTRLAGLTAIATGLTVREGLTYAATSAGLARYGRPAHPAVPLVDGLTGPSGWQWLILLLTLAVAGLVLVSWEKWFPAGQPVPYSIQTRNSPRRHRDTEENN